MRKEIEERTEEGGRGERSGKMEKNGYVLVIFRT